jgi:hypothetical protein
VLPDTFGAIGDANLIVSEASKHLALFRNCRSSTNRGLTCDAFMDETDTPIAQVRSGFLFSALGDLRHIESELHFKESVSPEQFVAAPVARLSNQGGRKNGHRNKRDRFPYRQR